jgi:hypothetical protein
MAEQGFDIEEFAEGVKRSIVSAFPGGPVAGCCCCTTSSTYVPVTGPRPAVSARARAEEV